MISQSKRMCVYVVGRCVCESFFVSEDRILYLFHSSGSINEVYSFRGGLCGPVRGDLRAYNVRGRGQNSILHRFELSVAVAFYGGISLWRRDLHEQTVTTPGQVVVTYKVFPSLLNDRSQSRLQYAFTYEATLKTR